MFVATTDSGVIDDADGSAFGLILAVGSSMDCTGERCVDGSTANAQLSKVGLHHHRHQLMLRLDVSNPVWQCPMCPLPTVGGESFLKVK